jgi:hypothetical protein
LPSDFHADELVSSVTFFEISLLETSFIGKVTDSVVSVVINEDGYSRAIISAESRRSFKLINSILLQMGVSS